MYYKVSNFHHFTPFVGPWDGFADGVAIRANRIPQFFNDSSKGAKAMETAKTQQEPIMNTEPQKEHQWLQKLVGEWTYETEAMMSPDQPPERATGTESVRSIGGFWVVGEGQGEMPCGGAATMIITLGYDPQKQRYVGTWVGSMMTYLWLYDGELDAAENMLTLNSDGPSMTGDEKIAKYRDVIEFKSNNHRVMTSYVLGDDGQWHQFMTVNSRRKQ